MNICLPKLNGLLPAVIRYHWQQYYCCTLNEKTTKGFLGVSDIKKDKIDKLAETYVKQKITFDAYIITHNNNTSKVPTIARVSC